MNIKLRIIELLRQWEEGKYSNIVIDNYFTKNRLTYQEKSFITEVFYGVIRNKILIDYEINKRTKKVKKKWIYYLLCISVYQGFFMDSDVPGIVWEAAELTKKKFGDIVSKFVNGLLRNTFRGKDETLKKLEEETKFNILYSYNDWAYHKLAEEFKEEYPKVMKSYKRIPKLSVRLNRLKFTEEKLLKYFEEQKIEVLKQVEDVYYLNTGKILSSSIFKKGKIIVQDASAYLAAKALDAKEGEVILDACSAPGGKSCVLATDMNNKGKIIALDIHPHKMRLIDKNTKKLGIKIVKTKILDARKVDELEMEFDKILLDVPCSGFGVIRKKPEAIYGKKDEDMKRLAKLQYEILESTSKTLKIGGSLVYSTCTIFRMENTDNVKKFLENNKGFEVEKIEVPKNVAHNYDELGGLNINYKDDYLDGFYMVKLKRVV